MESQNPRMPIARQIDGVMALGKTDTLLGMIRPLPGLGVVSRGCLEHSGIGGPVTTTVVIDISVDANCFQSLDNVLSPSLQSELGEHVRRTLRSTITAIPTGRLPHLHHHSCHFRILWHFT